MVLGPYSFPVSGNSGGSGGGGSTTIVYNAIVQAKSVSEFPATGKGNLLYIDTTGNEAYYWNDIDKKYVKIVSQNDDEQPKEEKVFIRRASLKEWQEQNSILEDGVIGYVTDDNSAKIGDGVTRWDSLPWFVKPIEIPDCGGLTVDDIYKACVSGEGLSAPLHTSDGKTLIDSNENTIQYNFKLKIK